MKAILCAIVLMASFSIASAQQPSCDQGQFCTHPGATHLTVDCDGDGILDHYCIDTQGQEGYISSENNCEALWPNSPCAGAPASAFPPEFCFLGQSVWLVDVDTGLPVAVLRFSSYEDGLDGISYRQITQRYTQELSLHVSDLSEWNYETSGINILSSMDLNEGLSCDEGTCTSVYNFVTRSRENFVVGGEDDMGYDIECLGYREILRQNVPYDCSQTWTYATQCTTADDVIDNTYQVNAVVYDDSNYDALITSYCLYDRQWVLQGSPSGLVHYFYFMSHEHKDFDTYNYDQTVKISVRPTTDAASYDPNSNTLTVTAHLQADTTLSTAEDLRTHTSVTAVEMAPGQVLKTITWVIREETYGSCSRHCVAVSGVNLADEAVDLGEECFDSSQIELSAFDAISERFCLLGQAWEFNGDNDQLLLNFLEYGSSDVVLETYNYDLSVKLALVPDSIDVNVLNNQMTLSALGFNQGRSTAINPNTLEEVNEVEIVPGILVQSLFYVIKQDVYGDCTRLCVDIGAQDVTGQVVNIKQNECYDVSAMTLELFHARGTENCLDYSTVELVNADGDSLYFKFLAEAIGGSVHTYNYDNSVWLKMLPDTFSADSNLNSFTYIVDAFDDDMNAAIQLADGIVITDPFVADGVQVTSLTTVISEEVNGNCGRLCVETYSLDNQGNRVDVSNDCYDKHPMESGDFDAIRTSKCVVNNIFEMTNDDGATAYFKINELDDPSGVVLETYNSDLSVKIIVKPDTVEYDMFENSITVTATSLNVDPDGSTAFDPNLGVSVDIGNVIEIVPGQMATSITYKIRNQFPGESEPGICTNHCVEISGLDENGDAFTLPETCYASASIFDTYFHAVGTANCLSLATVRMENADAVFHFDFGMLTEASGELYMYNYNNEVKIHLIPDTYEFDPNTNSRTFEINEFDYMNNGGSTAIDTVGGLLGIVEMAESISVETLRIVISEDVIGECGSHQVLMTGNNSGDSHTILDSLMTTTTITYEEFDDLWGLNCLSDSIVHFHVGDHNLYVNFPPVTDEVTMIIYNYDQTVKMTITTGIIYNDRETGSLTLSGTMGFDDFISIDPETLETVDSFEVAPTISGPDVEWDFTPRDGDCANGHTVTISDVGTGAAVIYEYDPSTLITLDEFNAVGTANCLYGAVVELYQGDESLYYSFGESTDALVMTTYNWDQSVKIEVYPDVMEVDATTNTRTYTVNAFNADDNDSTAISTLGDAVNTFEMIPGLEVSSLTWVISEEVIGNCMRICVAISGVNTNGDTVPVSDGCYDKVEISQEYFDELHDGLCARYSISDSDHIIREVCIDDKYFCQFNFRTGVNSGVDEMLEITTGREVCNFYGLDCQQVHRKGGEICSLAGEQDCDFEVEDMRLIVRCVEFEDNCVYGKALELSNDDGTMYINVNPIDSPTFQLQTYSVDMSVKVDVNPLSFNDDIYTSTLTFNTDDFNPDDPLVSKANYALTNMPVDVVHDGIELLPDLILKTLDFTITGSCDTELCITIGGQDLFNVEQSSTFCATTVTEIDQSLFHAMGTAECLVDTTFELLPDDPDADTLYFNTSPDMTVLRTYNHDQTISMTVTTPTPVVDVNTNTRTYSVSAFNTADGGGSAEYADTLDPVDLVEIVPGVLVTSLTWIISEEVIGNCERLCVNLSGLDADGNPVQVYDSCYLKYTLDVQAFDALSARYCLYGKSWEMVGTDSSLYFAFPSVPDLNSVPLMTYNPSMTTKLEITSHLTDYPLDNLLLVEADIEDGASSFVYDPVTQDMLSSVDMGTGSMFTYLNYDIQAETLGTCGRYCISISGRNVDGADEDILASQCYDAVELPSVDAFNALGTQNCIKDQVMELTNDDGVMYIRMSDFDETEGFIDTYNYDNTVKINALPDVYHLDVETNTMTLTVNSFDTFGLASTAMNEVGERLSEVEIVEGVIVTGLSWVIREEIVGNCGRICVTITGTDVNGDHVDVSDACYTRTVVDVSFFNDLHVAQCLWGTSWFMVNSIAENAHYNFEELGYATKMQAYNYDYTIKFTLVPSADQIVDDPLTDHTLRMTVDDWNVDPLGSSAIYTHTGENVPADAIEIMEGVMASSITWQFTQVDAANCLAGYIVAITGVDTNGVEFESESEYTTLIYDEDSTAFFDARGTETCLFGGAWEFIGVDNNVYIQYVNVDEATGEHHLRTYSQDFTYEIIIRAIPEYDAFSNTYTYEVESFSLDPSVPGASTVREITNNRPDDYVDSMYIEETTQVNSLRYVISEEIVGDCSRECITITGVTPAGDSVEISSGCYDKVPVEVALLDNIEDSYCIYEKTWKLAGENNDLYFKIEDYFNPVVFETYNQDATVKMLVVGVEAVRHPFENILEVTVDQFNVDMVNGPTAIDTVTGDPVDLVEIVPGTILQSITWSLRVEVPGECDRHCVTISGVDADGNLVALDEQCGYVSEDISDDHFTGVGTAQCLSNNHWNFVSDTFGQLQIRFGDLAADVPEIATYNYDNLIRVTMVPDSYTFDPETNRRTFTTNVFPIAADQLNGNELMNSVGGLTETVQFVETVFVSALTIEIREQDIGNCARQCITVTGSLFDADPIVVIGEDCYNAFEGTVDFDEILQSPCLFGDAVILSDPTSTVGNMNFNFDFPVTPAHDVQMSTYNHDLSLKLNVVPTDITHDAEAQQLLISMDVFNEDPSQSQVIDPNTEELIAIDHLLISDGVYAQSVQWDIRQETPGDCASPTCVTITGVDIDNNPFAIDQVCYDVTVIPVHAYDALGTAQCLPDNTWEFEHASHSLYFDMMPYSEDPADTKFVTFNYNQLTRMTIVPDVLTIDSETNEMVVVVNSFNGDGASTATHSVTGAAVDTIEIVPDVFLTGIVWTIREEVIGSCLSQCVRIYGVNTDGETVDVSDECYTVHPMLAEDFDRLGQNCLYGDTWRLTGDTNMYLNVPTSGAVRFQTYNYDLSVKMSVVPDHFSADPATGSLIVSVDEFNTGADVGSTAIHPELGTEVDMENVGIEVVPGVFMKAITWTVTERVVGDCSEGHCVTIEGLDLNSDPVSAGTQCFGTDYMDRSEFQAVGTSHCLYDQAWVFEGPNPERDMFINMMQLGSETAMVTYNKDLTVQMNVVPHSSSVDPITNTIVFTVQAFNTDDNASTAIDLVNDLPVDEIDMGDGIIATGLTWTISEQTIGDCSTMCVKLEANTVENTIVTVSDQCYTKVPMTQEEFTAVETAYCLFDATMVLEDVNMYLHFDQFGSSLLFSTYDHDQTIIMEIYDDNYTFDPFVNSLDVDVHQFSPTDGSAGSAAYNAVTYEAVSEIEILPGTFVTALGWTISLETTGDCSRVCVVLDGVNTDGDNIEVVDGCFDRSDISVDQFYAVGTAHCMSDKTLRFESYDGERMMHFDMISLDGTTGEFVTYNYDNSMMITVDPSDYSFDPATNTYRVQVDAFGTDDNGSEIMDTAGNTYGEVEIVEGVTVTSLTYEIREETIGQCFNQCVKITSGDAVGNEIEISDECFAVSEITMEEFDDAFAMNCLTGHTWAMSSAEGDAYFDFGTLEDIFQLKAYNYDKTIMMTVENGAMQHHITQNSLEVYVNNFGTEDGNSKAENTITKEDIPLLEIEILPGVFAQAIRWTFTRENEECDSHCVEISGTDINGDNIGPVQQCYSSSLITQDEFLAIGTRDCLYNKYLELTELTNNENTLHLELTDPDTVGIQLTTFNYDNSITIYMEPDRREQSSVNTITIAVDSFEEDSNSYFVDTVTGERISGGLIEMNEGVSVKSLEFVISEHEIGNCGTVCVTITGMTEDDVLTFLSDECYSVQEIDYEDFERVGRNCLAGTTKHLFAGAGVDYDMYIHIPMNGPVRLETYNYDLSVRLTLEPHYYNEEVPGRIQVSAGSYNQDPLRSSAVYPLTGLPVDVENEGIEIAPDFYLDSTSYTITPIEPGNCAAGHRVEIQGFFGENSLLNSGGEFEFGTVDMSYDDFRALPTRDCLLGQAWEFVGVDQNLMFDILAAGGDMALVTYNYDHTVMIRITSEVATTDHSLNRMTYTVETFNTVDGSTATNLLTGEAVDEIEIIENVVVKSLTLEIYEQTIGDCSTHCVQMTGVDVNDEEIYINNECYDVQPMATDVFYALETAYCMYDTAWHMVGADNELYIDMNEYGSPLVFTTYNYDNSVKLEIYADSVVEDLIANSVTVAAHDFNDGTATSRAYNPITFEDVDVIEIEAGVLVTSLTYTLSVETPGDCTRHCVRIAGVTTDNHAITIQDNCYASTDISDDAFNAVGSRTCLQNKAWRFESPDEETLHFEMGSLDSTSGTLTTYSYDNSIQIHIIPDEYSFDENLNQITMTASSFNNEDGTGSTAINNMGQPVNLIEIIPNAIVRSLTYVIREQIVGYCSTQCVTITGETFTGDTLEISHACYSLTEITSEEFAELHPINCLYDKTMELVGVDDSLYLLVPPLGSLTKLITYNYDHSIILELVPEFFFDDPATGTMVISAPNINTDLSTAYDPHTGQLIPDSEIEIVEGVFATSLTYTISQVSDDCSQGHCVTITGVDIDGENISLPEQCYDRVLIEEEQFYAVGTADCLLDQAWELTGFDLSVLYMNIHNLDDDIVLETLNWDNSVLITVSPDSVEVDPLTNTITIVEHEFNEEDSLSTAVHPVTGEVVDGIEMLPDVVVKSLTWTISERDVGDCEVICVTITGVNMIHQFTPISDECYTKEPMSQSDFFALGTHYPPDWCLWGKSVVWQDTSNAEIVGATQFGNFEDSLNGDLMKSINPTEQQEMIFNAVDTMSWDNQVGVAASTQLDLAELLDCTENCSSLQNLVTGEADTIYDLGDGNLCTSYAETLAQTDIGDCTRPWQLTRICRTADDEVITLANESVLFSEITPEEYEAFKTRYCLYDQTWAMVNENNIMYFDMMAYDNDMIFSTYNWDRNVLMSVVPDVLQEEPETNTITAIVNSFNGASSSSAVHPVTGDEIDSIEIVEGVFVTSLVWTISEEVYGDCSRHCVKIDGVDTSGAIVEISDECFMTMPMTQEDFQGLGNVLPADLCLQDTIFFLEDDTTQFQYTKFNAHNSEVAFSMYNHDFSEELFVHITDLDFVDVGLGGIETTVIHLGAEGVESTVTDYSTNEPKDSFEIIPGSHAESLQITLVRPAESSTCDVWCVTITYTVQGTDSELILAEKCGDKTMLTEEDYTNLKNQFPYDYCLWGEAYSTDSKLYKWNNFGDDIVFQRYNDDKTQELLFHANDIDYNPFTGAFETPLLELGSEDTVVIEVATLTELSTFQYSSNLEIEAIQMMVRLDEDSENPEGCPDHCVSYIVRRVGDTEVLPIPEICYNRAMITVQEYDSYRYAFPDNYCLYNKAFTYGNRWDMLFNGDSDYYLFRTYNFDKSQEFFGARTDYRHDAATGDVTSDYVSFGPDSESYIVDIATGEIVNYWDLGNGQLASAVKFEWFVNPDPDSYDGMGCRNTCMNVLYVPFGFTENQAQMFPSNGECGDKDSMSSLEYENLRYTIPADYPLWETYYADYEDGNDEPISYTNWNSWGQDFVLRTYLRDLVHILYVHVDEVHFDQTTGVLDIDWVVFADVDQGSYVRSLETDERITSYQAYGYDIAAMRINITPSSARRQLQDAESDDDDAPQSCYTETLRLTNGEEVEIETVCAEREYVTQEEFNQLEQGIPMDWCHLETGLILGDVVTFTDAWSSEVLGRIYLGGSQEIVLMKADFDYEHTTGILRLRQDTAFDADGVLTHVRDIYTGEILTYLETDAGVVIGLLAYTWTPQDTVVTADGCSLPCIEYTLFTDVAIETSLCADENTPIIDHEGYVDEQRRLPDDLCLYGITATYHPPDTSMDIQIQSFGEAHESTFMKFISDDRTTEYFLDKDDFRYDGLTGRIEGKVMELNTADSSSVGFDISTGMIVDTWRIGLQEYATISISFDPNPDVLFDADGCTSYCMEIVMTDMGGALSILSTCGTRREISEIEYNSYKDTYPIDYCLLGQSFIEYPVFIPDGPTMAYSVNEFGHEIFLRHYGFGNHELAYLPLTETLYNQNTEVEVRTYDFVNGDAISRDLRTGTAIPTWTTGILGVEIPLIAMTQTIHPSGQLDERGCPLHCVDGEVTYESGVSQTYSECYTREYITETDFEFLGEQWEPDYCLYGMYFNLGGYNIHWHEYESDTLFSVYNFDNSEELHIAKADTAIDQETGTIISKDDIDICAHRFSSYNLDLVEQETTCRMTTRQGNARLFRLEITEHPAYDESGCHVHCIHLEVLDEVTGRLMVETEPVCAERIMMTQLEYERLGWQDTNPPTEAPTTLEESCGVSLLELADDSELCVRDISYGCRNSMHMFVDLGCVGLFMLNGVEIECASSNGGMEICGPGALPSDLSIYDTYYVLAESLGEAGIPVHFHTYEDYILSSTLNYDLSEMLNVHTDDIIFNESDQSYHSIMLYLDDPDTNSHVIDLRTGLRKDTYEVTEGVEIQAFSISSYPEVVGDFTRVCLEYSFVLAGSDALAALPASCYDRVIIPETTWDELTHQYEFNFNAEAFYTDPLCSVEHTQYSVVTNLRVDFDTCSSLGDFTGTYHTYLSCNEGTVWQNFYDDEDCTNWQRSTIFTNGQCIMSIHETEEGAPLYIRPYWDTEKWGCDIPPPTKAPTEAACVGIESAGLDCLQGGVEGFCQAIPTIECQEEGLENCDDDPKHLMICVPWSLFPEKEPEEWRDFCLERNCGVCESDILGGGEVPCTYSPELGQCTIGAVVVEYDWHHSWDYECDAETEAPTPSPTHSPTEVPQDLCACVAAAGLCEETCSAYPAVLLDNEQCMEAFADTVCVDEVDNTFFNTPYYMLCPDQCLQDCDHLSETDATITCLKRRVDVLEVEVALNAGEVDNLEENVTGECAAVQVDIAALLAQGCAAQTDSN